MKIKYIVFYFIAAWIVVLMASIVIETYCISLAAKSVNNTVALAAEMAINTVQTSDEFFKGSTVKLDDGEGGNDLIGTYMTYVPKDDGKGYKRQNLFTEVAEKVWDVDLSYANLYDGTESGLDESESIPSDVNLTEVSPSHVYSYMYGTGNKYTYATEYASTFAYYLSVVGNLGNTNTHIPLSQIMYITKKGGVYGVDYATIPTTLRMGADLINDHDFNYNDKYKNTGLPWEYNDFSRVLKTGTASLNDLYQKNNAKDIASTYSSVVYEKDLPNRTTEYQRIAKANGFNTFRKLGSAVLTNGQYFITPLSLGLTYLDNDLLSYCFINNMDLLMRSKYISSKTVSPGTDLIETMTFGDTTGSGLNMGIGFNQYLDQNTLKNYNIINNGIFGFVKGESTNGIDFKPTFDGSTTSTKVTYMIIDMFNNTGDAGTKAATEEILKQVFGAYKGDKNKGTLKSTVGEYLKSISTDVDLITGAPLEHKYIVVAKCDFYADIIVPYTTPLFREFALKFVSNPTATTERSNGTVQIDNKGNITGQLASDNFLNLAYNEASSSEKSDERMVSKVTGNAMYHYTTYFAVAP